MSDIENTMPTEKEVREKVTAELEADFEKRVDQRIAEARKKWEKKRSREAAESLARIEKLKQIEEAERRKEREINDHELLIRGTRLDIIDLVAENGLDSRFRDMIPYEDLLILKNPVEIKQELKKRVIDIKREFNKLVQQEVKRQIECLQSMGC
ncbi:hypothetical protein [Blautia sp. MSJ-36]|uniref:hypothetical protein n=1 Tax=Blautia sp. MSJ-36 TaxID=2841530 RepID=UPI001C1207C3|nr:hypothetical protein [Blautia sp. MSJ-36]MBU5445717.1 hypothetical protein [Blautia sp. MSJ-36]